MSLDTTTREVIENHLQQNKVVLFMKGTPEQPQCGFSATTVGMLNQLLPEFHSINVLADEAIRDGIKIFGDWPTIPQLYIDGELVGGCDIITGMFNSGELHEMLGQPKPDRSPPEITITDLAAKNISEAMSGHDDMALHFTIDNGWQARFQLGAAEGHEIEVVANGMKILMDVPTAQKAKGAVIDWVNTLEGEGLKIDLPGAPKPVGQLSVTELKQRLDKNEILLLDIRNQQERALATISGAETLDKAMLEKLENMPKDTAMAFLCQHGNSSQGAAEHFRRKGFTNIHNVAGGINAWSLEVDNSVAQY
ncbi:MAG: Grx4 family monothiol glutaredoxin [Proteobacteria bacterium]|nr:Grx4 family monothiol glutaredoxin [Pseudomonadota bacterium]